MVCDKGVRQSGRCLEAADGVSSTAADSVWPQRVHPRCPHCGAWVSAVGRCQNPRCSHHGKEVIDMAKRHLVARCPVDTLSEATTDDVERAAYQMAYEGVPVAAREYNPFEEGDLRHTMFDNCVLEAKHDVEADAEVVRVIMDGESNTPPEQVDEAAPVDN